jgi:PAS domain S-box-containing protein
MTSSEKPSDAGGSVTEAAARVDRENPFRIIVEQVSEYAIFLLDPKGYVRTWNRGAQRIKGYAADEIIGKHFSNFYRPEDRWKCDTELAIATREGRVEDEGFRVRKDGSLFWASVVITCLRDDEGRIIGFGKVTRDITDRRRAAESLRQSEERFRLLVESVKDYAIFMLDPLGVVATWNIGAERIKGYRADEIIGQHFSRFYPEEDVRAGKCEWELEVASREGRFEDEGLRVRKDGSLFWANVVITALRDPQSNLIGFAKVTRDLTERRRAEEETRRLAQLSRERIHALAELSEGLAGALSVKDVANAVAGSGKDFAKSDTITLYLLDEESRTLQLVAERGCNPTLLEHIRSIDGATQNPCYEIGLGQAPAAWIRDREEYRRFFPDLAKADAQGERAQAFACVPLHAEGRTIGMLGIGFHQQHDFPEEQREFIGTFARQCAQALVRAQRLQAEREAAALAERLRASLDTTLRSIGDAVIATDAQGSITFMNEVAETLTAYPESEAQGRPLPEVFRIVNEHTRAEVQNPVEKVLETGGIVGLANHTVLLARDGREIPIDDSGAPIRSNGETVDGVVLVFRDVSERKQEEARRAFLEDATSALALSLDYEVTVARVAHLAVPRLADWCAVDLVVEGERMPRRLAVAHVDPAKVELARQLAAKYPADPDATTGVPNVLRTGKPELYVDVPEELLEQVAVDEEHLRIARELHLRSAMIVPLISRGRVLGAMSFVFAESGRHYGDADLHMAEDLAARCANAIENALLYRSEQQARRSADVANRAKDEFLAVVSHELRTPLNAILGWAKLLGNPDFDARRRQSGLQTIERNAVAMAQLVEDLLDMSRVISGKLRLEVQHLEIARVVDAAIESIRPAATAKGVDVSSILDTTVPPMMGDATRLQQVVWNLLSNAVKFSSKGGRVDVVLRRVASSVEIWVSDTGRGIAPAFLAYVFDPFRQEDASSSRARGGLGLGLAITKQLVELHGGRIEAHSEGEGRGARFVVSLPISSIPQAQGDRGKAARQFRKDGVYERPPHLRGLRVLVVDDEDDARDLVAIILEDCGCKVTTARSAREAMAKISEEVPDVLLSDIGMPERDGYDLIRDVRSLPRDQGGDVPAAALTAWARPEDRQRMLNAGYSLHLPKPVEPAELVAVVATLTRFIHRREGGPS